METFTAADREYIRRHFLTLEDACRGRDLGPAGARSQRARGLLPAPTYVLDDGTDFVPRDFFALVDAAGGFAHVRAHFHARWRAARRRNGLTDDSAAVEQDWRDYLSGEYGRCLRTVTPESIVRKEVLVSAVGELLATPRPDDESWRATLRTAVDELDRLETAFAPDFDRKGAKPPSRDRLVAAPRADYPEVFATPRG